MSRTPPPPATPNESPVDLGPGRFRTIQRLACAVGRGLASAHGQHQFYSLAQVQAQCRACAVDAALVAWVFAVFVTRADFEACFAMRETPGTYGQLRTALSPADPRVAPESWPRPWNDDDLDRDLDDLWSLFWRVAAT